MRRLRGGVIGSMSAWLPSRRSTEHHSGACSIRAAGRSLTNHNKLLWRYEGCVGVKTGYTKRAGRVLVSVLFPLVAPGVIATSIFAFIAAWNDYLFAYTFMQDQSRYTLPVWLASFSNPTTGTDFGGQMAASVLFSVPVVVFFLIIQRNLVVGLSAGAVKG